MTRAGLGQARLGLLCSDARSLASLLLLLRHCCCSNPQTWSSSASHLEPFGSLRSSSRKNDSLSKKTLVRHSTTLSR